MKTKLIKAQAIILALVMVSAMFTLVQPMQAKAAVHRVNNAIQLEAALQDTTANITLTNNISYTKPIDLTGSKVTINLDGFNLTITTTKEVSIALKDRAVLTVNGPGNLRVINDYNYFYGSAAVEPIPVITVDGTGTSFTTKDIPIVDIRNTTRNATGSGNFDDLVFNIAYISATDGATVDISGNYRGRLHASNATIKVNGGVNRPAYFSGGYIEALNNSSVTVTGNVVATGGIKADDKSTVTITGDYEPRSNSYVGYGPTIVSDNSKLNITGNVTGLSSYQYVEVSGKSEINIIGNTGGPINAKTGSAINIIGVAGDLYAYDDSTITVTGGSGKVFAYNDSIIDVGGDAGDVYADNSTAIMRGNTDKVTAIDGGTVYVYGRIRGTGNVITLGETPFESVYSVDKPTKAKIVLEAPYDEIYWDEFNNAPNTREEPSYVYKLWAYFRYEVTLDPEDEIAFKPVDIEYGKTEEQEVTVENTGNVATGDLEITITGENAEDFELGSTEIDSIAIDGSDTFTVSTKTGLDAGTYTATVTVSGTKIDSKSVKLTFTVIDPYVPEDDPEDNPENPEGLLPGGEPETPDPEGPAAPVNPYPANSKEAFVWRLYFNVLGRDPAGDSGFNEWVQRLESGEVSGIDAAARFFLSKEFTAIPMNNADFVDLMYQVMLGRPPELPETRNYWIGKLNQGAPRAVLVLGFAASEEFKGLCDASGIQNVPSGSQQALTRGFVARLYYMCLSREPEPEGMAAHVASLLNGSKKGREVATDFVMGDELSGSGITHEAFVQICYAAILGRDCTEEEIAVWVGRITDPNAPEGGSRENVFTGFVNSYEFATLCGEYGITP